MSSTGQYVNIGIFNIRTSAMIMKIIDVWFVVSHATIRSGAVELFPRHSVCAASRFKRVRWSGEWIRRHRLPLSCLHREFPRDDSKLGETLGIRDHLPGPGLGCLFPKNRPFFDILREITNWTIFFRAILPRWCLQIELNSTVWKEFLPSSCDWNVACAPVWFVWK